MKKLFTIIVFFVPALFVTLACFGQRSITEPQPSFSSPRNIAILVGVGNYSDSPRIQNLRYPETEVDILQSTLSRDWNFNRNDIYARKGITGKHFMSMLDTLQRRITANDNLIIYLSMHGLKLTDNDYYLLFSDAKKDQEETWVPAWRILDKIKTRFHCKKILLIVDACFSGSFITDTKKSLGPPAPQLVSQYIQFPSAEIITAGDSFTPLPDKSEFFEALIKVLDRWEYNQLPAEDLKEEIRYQMAIQNSRSIPLHSHLPLIRPSLGGSFVFTKVGGKDLPPIRPGSLGNNATPPVNLSLSTGPTYYDLSTTNPNEEFDVNVSGYVTVGQFLGTVSPDGRATGLLGMSIDNYDIVPKFPHGGVMYRLSSKDSWQFCGKKCTIKVASPGKYKVEFLINDNNVSDNSGSFEVRIQKM